MLTCTCSFLPNLISTISSPFLITLPSPISSPPPTHLRITSGKAQGRGSCGYDHVPGTTILIIHTYKSICHIVHLHSPTQLHLSYHTHNLTSSHHTLASHTSQTQSTDCNRTISLTVLLLLIQVQSQLSQMKQQLLGFANVDNSYLGKDNHTTSNTHSASFLLVVINLVPHQFI